MSTGQPSIAEPETTDLDPGILPELVGYQLRRAQVATFQHFIAALRDLDITPGQFGALVLIERNGGLSQTALGNALGIDRSTVVPLIDKLEQRGLVVRTAKPGDRRSHALKLSTDGCRRLAEITAAVRRHEAHIARQLSAAERAQLIALLARVAL